MFDRPPSSKSFSKYIFTMLKRLANQQTTTSYMQVHIEIRIFMFKVAVKNTSQCES